MQIVKPITLRGSIKTRKKFNAISIIIDGIAFVFLGRIVLLILSGYSFLNSVSYGLLPLWFILVVSTERRRKFWKAVTFSKGVVLGLAGFSFWIFGEMAIGRSRDTPIIWPLMTAAPFYLIASYYGCNHTTKFWMILKVLLAVYGLQALYSIPFMIEGTWAPRTVMYGVALYGKAAGQAFIRDAARHGIGAYGYYMSTAIIACIVAGLALTSQKGIVKRAFWFIAWGALVLANILSTFTASALIACLGSILTIGYALVSRRLNLSGILVVAVIAGLCGWMLIDKISQAGGYEFTIKKASMVFESVEDGGIRSETTGRGNGLFESWDAFAKSPFVGYGTQGSKTVASGTFIGFGHSTWLNTLVYYGLAGGFWYFLMVFSVGWQIWKAVKMRPTDLLAVSFMSAYVSLLIYGIINTVMLDIVFFFVLYGGAMALRKQPDKRLFNNKSKYEEGSHIKINRLQIANMK